MRTFSREARSLQRGTDAIGDGEEVRYRHRGKMKTYLQLGAALATRKVTLDAVRKGMNIAKVFSRPETFLCAHAQEEIPGTNPQ